MTETLEDQRSRTIRYDDRKNQLYTVDANGTQLLYAYDPFGNLLYVEDVQGKHVLLRQTYDARIRTSINAGQSCWDTKRPGCGLIITPMPMEL